MKTIKLTNGYICLVDDEDHPRLSRYQWYADIRTSGHIYAKRFFYKNGKNGSRYMHRDVLRLRTGDRRKVDHREPSATLDNRKINLRFCTVANNQWNRRIDKRSTTGLKGAFPKSGRPGWYYSKIMVNGKLIQLGHFRSAMEAHTAYREAALHYHGEFART